MNAGFSGSFRPWDFFATGASKPSLHVNDLLRTDPRKDPDVTQDAYTLKVQKERDELRQAHQGMVSEITNRNVLPVLGKFNTVRLPPAGFEQVGYLQAMENCGYLEWLKANSRTRAAEALNSLLPEHRERWIELTAFGNSLISSSTGVFSLMEELYNAYDLIGWHKKAAERYLDELAECQKKFNIQFTHNMELGMILQNAYELLGKADPDGKLVPEFKQRILEGQAQLDPDQEHWFRPRWADTVPKKWSQQSARDFDSGNTSSETEEIREPDAEAGPSTRTEVTAPEQDSHRSENSGQAEATVVPRIQLDPGTLQLLQTLKLVLKQEQAEELKERDATKALQVVVRSLGSLKGRTFLSSYGYTSRRWM
ncbi:hypothetical protein R1sor_011617 [Riccia sorocarpa]|uniref:Uncharacterized protein n=1 Tax=Riccia sorocarpa TaxID=122646 RepID=A0ABD3I5N4_9MARC